MRSIPACIVIALMITTLGLPARGVAQTQDLNSTETQDEFGDQLRAWTVEVEPYLFLPQVEGDASAGGVVTSVDLSLSDMIDALDFVAYGRVEAWHDNQVGFIVDGLYENLAFEGSLNRNRSFTVAIEFELSIGPFPPRIIRFERDVRIDLDAKIDVDWRYTVVDLAMGYRLYDGPLDKADPESPGLVLDLIGGARYQRLRQDITVRGDLKTRLFTIPWEVELGEEHDWIEPLIGGRVGLVLDGGHTLTIRGDASGFGIGSGSRLTWNAAALLDLQVTDDFNLILGYRMLGTDYARGSGADAFGIDVLQHGPYVGFQLTF